MQVSTFLCAEINPLWCVRVCVRVCVCVCVRVCVCVCVSPVNPQEVINARTLTLTDSLSFPRRSGGNDGFHCKPEESHTVSAAEQLVARTPVTFHIYIYIYIIYIYIYIYIRYKI